MSVQDEAQYAATIREFTRLFNRRVMPGKRVKENSSWVRIRPPTLQEATMAQEDPRTLPFLRVGSVGTVIEDGGAYIDLSIGGNRLLIGREEFLSTWTRVVEQVEWRKEGQRDPWRRGVVYDPLGRYGL